NMRPFVWGIGRLSARDRTKTGNSSICRQISANRPTLHRPRPKSGKNWLVNSSVGSKVFVHSRRGQPTVLTLSPEPRREQNQNGEDLQSSEHHQPDEEHFAPPTEMSVI